MTIYGIEIDFETPKTDYETFLDAFDVALEPLNTESGFYSVDAHVNKTNGSVLVGVNVPDAADTEKYFNEAIATLVLPALESAGIDLDSLVIAETKQAFALA